MMYPGAARKGAGFPFLKIKIMSRLRARPEKVKRGFWIAFWAVVAYAATWAGLSLCTHAANRLLAGVAMPAWLAQHIGLMTELGRGLMPYVAGAVIFALGLGAHLPGTRKPGVPH